MPDIASTDVTYTIVDEQKVQGRRLTQLDAAFGDGVLTYPSGGVPLDKTKMGTPNEIIELNIVDAANANGLVYKYDKANNKLRIYEGDYAQAGDAPLVELDSGSDAPAAATLVLSVRGF